MLESHFEARRRERASAGDAQLRRFDRLKVVNGEPIFAVCRFVCHKAPSISGVTCCCNASLNNSFEGVPLWIVRSILESDRGLLYPINLYPSPGTVTIRLGCFGSGSSFWRRLPT